MAGIFGYVDQKDFDSFRGEINKKLSLLERQIASKVTDSEQAAEEAARSAEKSSKDAEERAAQINEIYIGLDRFQRAISEHLEKIKNDEASLNQKLAAI